MARTLWKGSISFGLVNVPVRMATAVREKAVHFHMLSKDGSCRLRRKLVCPETGEEYDFQDTAKGYEVAPDQYLIIKDEELEKIKPEKGRTIDSPYGPVVHLDLRHLGKKTIDTKIPFVRELCKKYQNVDPVTDLIPVRPVVHYMMGGVHTDINGATPLPEYPWA